MQYQASEVGVAAVLVKSDSGRDSKKESGIVEQK